MSLSGNDRVLLKKDARAVTLTAYDEKIYYRNIDNPRELNWITNDGRTGLYQTNNDIGSYVLYDNCVFYNNINTGVVYKVDMESKKETQIYNGKATFLTILKDYLFFQNGYGGSKTNIFDLKNNSFSVLN